MAAFACVFLFGSRPRRRYANGDTCERRTSGSMSFGCGLLNRPPAIGGRRRHNAEEWKCSLFKSLFYFCEERERERERERENTNKREDGIIIILKQNEKKTKKNRRRSRRGPWPSLLWMQLQCCSGAANEPIEDDDEWLPTPGGHFICRSWLMAGPAPKPAGRRSDISIPPRFQQVPVRLCFLLSPTPFQFLFHIFSTSTILEFDHLFRYAVSMSLPFATIEPQFVNLCVIPLAWSTNICDS